MYPVRFFGGFRGEALHVTIMPDQRFDIVIIGGGIIGLSTAMHLQLIRPQAHLLVVEKESAVAEHQSGHNSGVLHSGVYYKPGSLKARLCVQGAAAMVEFCREHRVPHQICGKVIVASCGEEIPALEMLKQRGEANGLAGLRMLTREQLREVEPYCGGVRALHVPGTGITDYAAVCKKYSEIFCERGGSISTGTEVTGLQQHGAEMAVESNRGSLAAHFVINCAGLHSDRVSQMAGQKPMVKIVPFRGEYYDLAPQSEHLVRALIYPVPDPQFPFLGVHFTRRIRGGVDAGPNAVLAFQREGYRRRDFNARDFAGTLSYSGFWRMAVRHWRYGLKEFHRSLSKRQFTTALQRLVPDITESDLIEGGSGVRAQALRQDGSLVDDFQFAQSEKMLHVLNVPSPAATASLPIGQMLAEMAAKQLGKT
jgi:L-2-hydroxyglutarate oxidase